MKKRNWLISILLTFIILFLGIMISISYDKDHLQVNQFEVKSSKITSPLHLLLLSDLHDHEFGDGNMELVIKVVAQEPDMVLMLGDFVNAESADASVPCTLIENLVKKLPSDVPVYFALGNHEEGYMAHRASGQENGEVVGEDVQPSLITELEQAGAIVLDKAFVDLEICGQQVRLGGMYDYAFGLNGEDEAQAAPADVKAFLREFQDTDALKIMMAHRPDSFIFGNASAYWDIDLVLSGHVHGGQVVLPFFGGVWGMDQGWFPEYVHGMYQKDKMNLFVTSGLGSGTQVLPRINNPPEIAVLDILPEENPADAGE